LKITKDDLIKNGIDPSLYNSEDMAAIEQYADSIKEGSLPSLLEKISTPSANDELYKEKANEARQKVLVCLKELSDLLDAVYGMCASKQSIFSSSLSPEDTDRILVGSMNAFNRMFKVKDEAMDHVVEMFNFKQELAEIRHSYNKKLYCAGMINAAYAVVCPEGDNSEIVEASGTAFERFNDLTEFINDTNDRIIIFDEALNHKLARSWNNITIFLDFDGDGAKLNTQKVKSEIETAKQMLKDVIER